MPKFKGGGGAMTSKDESTLGNYPAKALSETYLARYC